VESRNLSIDRIPEDCDWQHPWNTVAASLASKIGPHRVHHYTSEGQPLSKSLGAQAEMIAAGHTTAVQQETCSFAYHCFEGRGQTHITTSDGKQTTFKWASKDTFAVPAWSKVVHVNEEESETAYLFAINDRPFLENLGLYRKAGECFNSRVQVQGS